MPRRRKNLRDPGGQFRGNARLCAAHLEGDDLTSGLAACQELINLVTIHEERLVRLARAAGWSWHTIAFYLGVSHQAVHRKWRRKIHGDAYDPKSGRRKVTWNERYGPG